MADLKISVLRRKRLDSATYYIPYRLSRFLTAALELALTFRARCRPRWRQGPKAWGWGRSRRSWSRSPSWAGLASPSVVSIFWAWKFKYKHNYTLCTWAIVWITENVTRNEASGSKFLLHVQLGYFQIDQNTSCPLPQPGEKMLSLKNIRSVFDMSNFSRLTQEAVQSPYSQIRKYS